MNPVFRIASISDTHRQHLHLTKLLSRGGDLLVHTGDADCADEETWTTFINWLKKMSRSFKHGVVFVPGNHDTYVFNNLEDCREDLENSHVHLLVNQSIEVGGIKIFGSPYVQPVGHPDLSAFTASGQNLEELWEQIPFDLDLLLTHGPASGILDAWFGDPWLFEAIKSKKPAVHIFGHIHQQAGSVQREHTLHVNASIVGSYALGPFQPTWIDYDLITKKATASQLITLDVT